MCGRFTRTTPVRDLAPIFDFPEVEEAPPRYNVAPSQSVAVVRPAAERPGRELAWMRWGLVPSWADDLKIGYKLINARSETVAAKPAFRAAFRQRRCLLPADGFFEWQATGGKTKQPWWIGRQDGKPFAIAGLWERWQDPEGKPVLSCTIITGAANEVVRPIHDRMPVILAPADWPTWLADSQDLGRLQELLQPFPAEQMATRPVSAWVNSPKHDDPQCLANAASGLDFGVEMRRRTDWEGEAPAEPKP